MKKTSIERKRGRGRPIIYSTYQSLEDTAVTVRSLPMQEEVGSNRGIDNFNRTVHWKDKIKEKGLTWKDFLNRLFPASFCLFFRIFNTVDSKHCPTIFLPMTGFEPRTSGVGSDRTTNWATTAHCLIKWKLLDLHQSLSLSLTHTHSLIFSLCLSLFFFLSSFIWMPQAFSVPLAFFNYKLPLLLDQRTTML